MTIVTNSGLPENLAELEARLSTLSHDDQALKIIQNFAQKLGKTSKRQDLFNSKGALVREPIIYQDVLSRGLINADEDPFTLLQGDIISTDAAYFLGERITGMKFAIATSTCDLVPGCREYAALLRVQPIKTDDPNPKQLLGELLKFNSTQRMYLPPLPGDSSDVIANALDIVKLKRHFRVSYLVILKRLAEMGIVDYFKEKAKIYGIYKKQHGAKLQDSMELPPALRTEEFPENERFVYLIWNALKLGKISEMKAAELLNITVEQLRVRRQESEVYAVA